MRQASDRSASGKQPAVGRQTPCHGRARGLLARGIRSVAASTHVSNAPEPNPRRWAGVVFVLSFGVWLALNGWTAWALGSVVAACAAGAGAALAPGDLQGLRWARWPGFVAYFLRQSLLGGVDVARRALHPRLPLAPHFIDVALRVPSGPARTLLIGLVNLIPGSLAADLDDARDLMRVHLLAAHGDAGLDELQARVAALFGLGPQ